MLKADIMPFFRGKANAGRRATFNALLATAMTRNGQPLFLSGSEFSAAVTRALNGALAGADGWPHIGAPLSSGTANAVAAALEERS